MKRALLAVVLVGGCPAAVVEGDPAPGGPALVFSPLPDAFRMPDDDVDDEADGLQIDVELVAENVDDADADAVEVVSAGGFVDSAEFVDGSAVVRVALDVAAFPGGASNVVTATAGDLEARRTIIGLDRRGPPRPTPPTCSLDVDGAGVATVECSVDDDEDNGAVIGLARGGLVALATDDGAGDVRVRSAELSGGRHVFAFAFDVDGSYEFVARLVDAEEVTGAVVEARATKVVDVP